MTSLQSESMVYSETTYRVIVLLSGTRRRQQGKEGETCWDWWPLEYLHAGCWEKWRELYLRDRRFLLLTHAWFCNFIMPISPKIGLLGLSREPLHLNNVRSRSNLKFDRTIRKSKYMCLILRASRNRFLWHGEGPSWPSIWIRLT